MNIVERVKHILSWVEFSDGVSAWRWLVVMKGDNAALYAAFEDPDGATQNTRKWLISPHATDSEIVQTALACALTGVEHEARERFLVDGLPLFGPHWSVRQLSEMFDEEKLDRRQPSQSNGAACVLSDQSMFEERMAKVFKERTARGMA